MPDYQAEKGNRTIFDLFWLLFCNYSGYGYGLTSCVLFRIDLVTDKAKRFLAEFYLDGDGGKHFKYGEQLVSRNLWITSPWVVWNLLPLLSTQRIRNIFMVEQVDFRLSCSVPQIKFLNNVFFQG